MNEGPTQICSQPTPPLVAMPPIKKLLRFLLAGSTLLLAATLLYLRLSAATPRTMAEDWSSAEDWDSAEGVSVYRDGSQRPLTSRLDKKLRMEFIFGRQVRAREFR